MEEIDRALQSRASAARLVELLGGHLLACTGCEVLLIGVREREVPTRMTVVLSLARGAEAAGWKCALDASTRELLAVAPDGVWVHQVRDYTLLQPVSAHGAVGTLVLPVYEDADPVGLIALAGRLGAALTSVARAESLYAKSHFDATTALPNWQYLKDHLGQHMSRARRDRGRLALLFIDLDGFKKVNRSKGHSQGDVVLAEAAHRMRSCVRDEDLVTRFGGDEFVVVLPRVADKLIEALALPFVVEGEEHHVGCSIGISVFPDDAHTADAMLRSADSALFSAKAMGGGRYAFFDATMNRAAVDRICLEQDLRRALANDEFSVVYQPQIDLRSGRIDGAEARVRWQHPTRGFVPPLEFIALAETTGQIAQLGEYVMRSACRQFRAWDAAGVAPQRIAMNVSCLEITRTDIVARVEDVLRQTGLRPLHLELEITEGILLDDSGETLVKLQQLRQRGVRISVDDFGTGFFSLSYLRRLPVDVVKIDQIFVRELSHDQDSRAITKAILKVARSLGKSVVAEGVETREQRDLRAHWGCDMGQGYLWSRPLAAPAFEAFCREWRAAPQGLLDS